MRTRFSLALVAAGALGLAACGDRVDMPFGLAVGNAPEGGVFIQVSDETGTSTPLYQWSGTNARALAVTRVSDGFLMWRVEAIDADQGFDGPVQHGETPVGGQQTQEATLLVAGEEYNVLVTTVDGSEGRFRFRS